MKKQYYCIDCRKEIKKKASKRCYSCSKMGDKNPRFVRNKKRCIDCNKLLSKNKYIRCRPCNTRGEQNVLFGVNKKGKTHPAWIDGRSYEKYPAEFTVKLREKIRNRDNYKCQGENCSMTQEEHFIVYGRDLEVHHIDYNRKNCNKNNLITLCKQCNLRANDDRDYWFEYYTNLIELVESINEQKPEEKCDNGNNISKKRERRQKDNKQSDTSQSENYHED